VSPDDSTRKAVAVAYDPGADAAPRVTARGKGALSDLIVRLAEEHGIPIHGDPILADALSRFPEGDPIPPELYAAVAEIYAFLIRTRRLVLGENFSPPARGGRKICRDPGEREADPLRKGPGKDGER
jgi:flagellar biosynthesis protein